MQIYYDIFHEIRKHFPNCEGISVLIRTDDEGISEFSSKIQTELEKTGSIVLPSNEIMDNSPLRYTSLRTPFGEIKLEKSES